MGRRRLNRFEFEHPTPETLEKYLKSYDGFTLHHHPETLPDITSQNFFGNSQPLCLDLGCGRGEFVVEQAKANPDKNYLGIEHHTKSIHNAVTNANAAHVENVRFLRSDIHFCQVKTPPSSAQTVYLLFPSPIVKKKFLHKDYITPVFVAKLHEILQREGTVHFATDHHAYFNRTVDLFVQSGLFETINRSEGFEGGITWYQKVWESHGLKTFRAEYVRKD